MEGGPFAVLLAHKDQRSEWGEQNSGSGELQGFAINEGSEAISAWPVANLVVVLSADHHSPRPNARGRIAVTAVAKGRVLPSIGVALGEDAGELLHATEVLIVSGSF